MEKAYLPVHFLCVQEPQLPCLLGVFEKGDRETHPKQTKSWKKWVVFAKVGFFWI